MFGDLFVKPKDDAALGQVIGGHFDIHPVPNQHLDPVFAQLARAHRQNDMLILQLHAEHRIGQQFRHYPRKFN
jgi:hypothetical protein